MFLIAQLPLADLRILAPDQRGRLETPDWTKVDPGPAFVRGFGRMSARNLSSLGMPGERAFADFDQAARFRADPVYTQPGWSTSIRVKPWFRRLYFDGHMAGRFEFGFMVADEAAAAGLRTGERYDVALVAAWLEALPILVRGPDIPGQVTNLSSAGNLLAQAYVAATTRRDAMFANPVNEVCARDVSVGPLSIHIRVPADRLADPGRAVRTVEGEGATRLFIATAKGSPRRNTVLVQASGAGVLDEAPQERAVRILFSHLNALIFALSQAEASGAQSGRAHGRAAVLAQIDAAMARLARFRLQPADGGDALIAAAFRAFGTAYAGRIEDLRGQLEALAEQLKAPTLADKAGGYLKGLVDLALTTGVKTAVEAGLKGAGA